MATRYYAILTINYTTLGHRLASHTQLNPNLQDTNWGSSALHWMCYKNYAGVIKTLLDKHPETNINITDKWGDSPLMVAVRKGYVECVGALLNRNDLDLSIKNTDGETPESIARWGNLGGEFFLTELSHFNLPWSKNYFAFKGIYFVLNSLV